MHACRAALQFLVREVFSFPKFARSSDLCDTRTLNEFGGFIVGDNSQLRLGSSLMDVKDNA
jgi:hypothetical protein